MKAMVLHEQAQIVARLLRMEEVPEPRPGPGRARLKVSDCGICHTDLHAVEEDLGSPTSYP
jgi:propanol-preferring alcohol dehydrogenase